MTCRLCAVLSLLCGVAAFPVAAADIAIQNAGFELPAIPSGTFDTNAPPPPGWIVYGANVNFGFRTVGVLDPTGTTLYPGGAPEGENVGVVFLLDDPQNQTVFAGMPAGLEQTLDDDLEADTVYTLTVGVGNIGNDADPPNDQFQFAGFPGYRIELLAGGVPVAFDENSVLPPEGGFLTVEVEAVIGQGHSQEGLDLGIRLINLNAAPGIEVNFDDVTLVSAPAGTGQVPDGNMVPGSPLLLGKGEGGDLALSWDPSCFAGDTDYAVYEGALGDFVSHAPAGATPCTTSGSLTVVLTPDPGPRYFLLVPQSASLEGSYGFDSSGASRPRSLQPCRPEGAGSCP